MVSINFGPNHLFIIMDCQLISAFNHPFIIFPSINPLIISQIKMRIHIIIKSQYLLCTGECLPPISLRIVARDDVTECLITIEHFLIEISQVTGSSAVMDKQIFPIIEMRLSSSLAKSPILRLFPQTLPRKMPPVVWLHRARFSGMIACTFS